MDNFAINNLANMERMLYGYNSGRYMNCPSIYNGYLGNTNLMNYYNPMFRGYGNYNKDIFTQYNDATRVNNPYQTAAQGSSKVDWNNPQFRGLGDDINELGDYYVKNSAPSESFMGAVTSGLTFGLMNNPRMIAHPINSLKTTFAGDVNKMFAGIKVDKSKLNLLYNDQKGGYEILSEAYSRMHKLESLNNSKLGLFRKSIKDVKGADGKYVYDKLKLMMEKALKTGDPKKIAEATEEIKRVTNAYTGRIPEALRKMGLQDQLTWLRKKINPSQYETASKVVKKNLAESGAKMSLKSSLAHSSGIGNGLFFAAFEFLNDLVFEQKIQKAFDKDKATGWTQVAQTTIKGVGSAAGWAVGEGVGAWAGAKIGAAIGTAVAPGVGTAIGAVAGLVGGMVGSWAAGKLVHKVIGDDVGTKAEVEKMKKTAQGQQQLLQLTAQQAQDDKNISNRTFQAIQNVANYYSANA